MSSSDEAAEEYSVIYDEIEVMDPVMYIDERRDLGYHLFNRGVEAATAAGTSLTQKPCDLWFLVNLSRDYRFWCEKAACEVQVCRDMDAKMNPYFVRAVKYVYAIMREVLRLRAAPELFPEPWMMPAFLEDIGEITENMVSLGHLCFSWEIMEQQSRMIVPLQHRPILARRVGKVWFKVRQVIKKLPDLHPHAGKRNPWNRWLDGQHDSQHPDCWDIRQRVPIVGVKLLRRQRFMYGVVKRSYEANRVIRDEADHMKLAEATGEDYSTLYQATNLQLRGRLGFSIGDRKSYDSHGLPTLEYLSKYLRAFQKRRFATESDVQPILSIIRM